MNNPQPAVSRRDLLRTVGGAGATAFTILRPDPDRFMEALNKYGLPWQIVEHKGVPDEV